MAKSVHPMSFDHHVPRDFAAWKATQTRNAVPRRDVLVTRRAIMGMMVAIGAFLLTVVLAPGDQGAERVAVAASMPSAEAAHASAPTDYFPAQFVVKHWDESPMPEQF